MVFENDGFDGVEDVGELVLFARSADEVRVDILVGFVLVEELLLHELARGYINTKQVSLRRISERNEKENERQS